MNVLSTIAKVYNKFEEVFLVILLSVMVVLIFGQVIMRYIFNAPLSWSEELARILFIWVSWIGISLGQKKGEHIRIVLVTDALKGKTRKFVLLLSDVCAFIILMIFAIYGAQVFMDIFGRGATLPGTHLPKWTMYGAVPVSCTLMAIRIIKDFVDVLLGRKEENKEVVLL